MVLKPTDDTFAARADIDASLVAHLVSGQFPEWADLVDEVLADHQLVNDAMEHPCGTQ